MGAVPCTLTIDRVQLAVRHTRRTRGVVQRGEAPVEQHDARACMVDAVDIYRPSIAFDDSGHVADAVCEVWRFVGLYVSDCRFY